jgi:hypothetical protein
MRGYIVPRLSEKSLTSDIGIVTRRLGRCGEADENLNVGPDFKIPDALWGWEA